MQVAESSSAIRSARLEKLIRLYETGQVSDLMDRVLVKAFAQEAAEAEAAIKRIDSDLQAYEAQYGMSSESFYRQDNFEQANWAIKWTLSSGVR
jgi:hypothetical protein